MHDNDELTDVLDQLGVLEPRGENAATSPQQALAEFKQMAHPSLQVRSHSIMRRFAPVAVFAVLAIALFTQPAARAMASSFLGLFRVEKFAAISVSPQQLEALGALVDSGLYPGEITMLDEPAAPIAFASFAEAERHMTQLEKPVWVTSAFSLGEPDFIEMQGSGSAEMLINLEGARGILDAVDGDPTLLPDSLDGATIDMHINEVLIQDWDEGVALIQTLSPEIGYPENVDPAVIGEAILQFLGMEDGEAYRLAHNIDWTSTMILPIPSDVGTFKEVSIGSTTGLAIEPLGSEAATLMWQEHGKVYVLAGQGEYASVEALIELIESGGIY